MRNHEHFQEMALRRLGDVTGKTYFLRYARDVLKTSHKRHLFKDVFETSQGRHIKDIFTEKYLRLLKDVTKRHLLWDVSKTSLRCLSQWRSDWDLSETSITGWLYDFAVHFSIKIRIFAKVSIWWMIKCNLVKPSFIWNFHKKIMWRISVQHIFGKAK